mmetsp:Transcript_43845/g.86517  ORF Transcript_43845/g.86517 Transcript_43845/m.86517 type:complete len:352 (-) Transcript_43845:1000-2055(-)
MKINDSNLFRNRLCRQRVITCDHHHLHPRSTTSANGSWNLHLGWVHQCYKPPKDQLPLSKETFTQLVGVQLLQITQTPQSSFVHGEIPQPQHATTFPCQRLVRSREPLVEALVLRLCNSVVEHCAAHVHDSFRGPLQEQNRSSIASRGRRETSSRRGRGNTRSGALLLPVCCRGGWSAAVPVCCPCPLTCTPPLRQDRRFVDRELPFVPRVEGDLKNLRILLPRCQSVMSTLTIPQDAGLCGVSQDGAWCSVLTSVEVCSAAVCENVEDLRPGGGGHVSNPRLGSHEGIAYLDLGVEPDVRDCHPVLCQGAGLVGGNHRHAAESLHRLQLLHEDIFCRKSLRHNLQAGRHS